MTKSKSSSSTIKINRTAILLFFAILGIIIALGLVASYIIHRGRIDLAQYIDAVVQNLMSTTIILVLLVAFIGVASMEGGTT